MEFDEEDLNVIQSALGIYIIEWEWDDSQQKEIGRAKTILAKLEKRRAKN